jgi:hypothetical protein
MPITSTVVTVGTSPTLLSDGGSGDLHTVVVRNDSGVTLYIGGSTVAVASGLQVPTASTFTLDLANADALFGVVAAATQPIQVLRTRQ